MYTSDTYNYVSLVLCKLLVTTKQTRSKNRDLGIALENVL